VSRTWFDQYVLGISRPLSTYHSKVMVRYYSGVHVVLFFAQVSRVTTGIKGEPPEARGSLSGRRGSSNSAVLQQTQRFVYIFPYDVFTWVQGHIAISVLLRYVCS